MLLAPRLKASRVRLARVLQQSSRLYSAQGLDSTGIAELLAKPTWSVKELHGESSTSKPLPSITKQQLHHLLRLSALPLPKDEAEESGMIKMLESQLQFVQAVQDVDTAGVKPLRSIRDETIQAQQEIEVTAESLKEHLAKESFVGFSRRIVRKEEPVALDESQQYDPLSQAPKTVGRYVIVNKNES